MGQRQIYSQPSLPPPMLITRRDQLAQLERSLSHTRRIAIDTESNSLYAYTERVCLIQLSTDQVDFLIDPLGFERPDLEFLARICSDQAVEKVVHAAEYDVMVLRRDLDFHFANIFDTMIAARILGWSNFGLAALLVEHFGVQMNKTHQRANWGRRPLSSALIEYAQLDVHFLLPLSDILRQALATVGCLDEAGELFDEVCRARWRGGNFDPDGFWTINGVRALPPAGISVFKELYLYREEQAHRQDLPVFKVLSDATLMELATARPRSLDELHRLRALSEGQFRRYGSDIMARVQRGLKTKPPHPAHRQNGVDELTTRRFEALHAWRKDKAIRRGVPSDIVLSKDALWELAVVAPRSTGQLGQLQFIGPWRRKTYGDEILQILSNVDNGDNP